jgi:UPF0755 protein
VTEKDEEHLSFDEIASAQQERDESDAAAATGHGRRRARRRRREKRTGLRRALPILLVFVVIIAVVGGGGYGYHWVTENVNVDASGPDDYEGDGTSEEVVVTIADGDSGADIADTLVEAGVIRSAAPFTQLFNTDQDAASISAGQYRLHAQMSSASALEALQDPDSLAGYRVTIPEGLRMSAIFDRLSEATGIPVKDFEKAAADYRSHGIPKNPAKSAEGYLWPGRYDIPEDATAGDVLDLMAQRMDSELDKRDVPEKDRHKVLTIASIAEKEAANPDDFGKVARSVDNRLAGAGEAHGHPMKLQLDSTVAYASGRESVSTTPKERAKNSPYNTYKHAGLPVGPISNPGPDAIDAVLDPPQGKWLYWVTVNTETGKTKFADTKSEHDKNVQEWQQWAKKNGKG